MPKTLREELRTVFLGSVLEERDFDIAADAGGQKQKLRFFSGNLQDRSRDAFFVRVSSGPAKPRGAGRDGSDSRRANVFFPSLEMPVPQTAHFDTKIIFTANNYSLFFDHLTFADIKGLLTQEELGGYLEFTARAGAGGSIDSLEKVVGSGDPLLDSYVMHKIKSAILRRPPTQGAMLKLFFFLKSKSDVSD